MQKLAGNATANSHGRRKNSTTNNMNVMKMRMYRRRCHVCGKVCNTTTLAAICARCRNIKRDTKMICGDAFSREHNNDVAKQPNGTR